ncbi:2'-5' RNA ligase [Amycolatopsis marina]|uniref:2'-5' RNA ligase n=1 Tax=Amycolatopsis marina TaxID=490629 RepID=A0A1I1CAU7_9PSEU|nr:2'-5' RNA ligase family protein [Amycolatopsis marina]SFB59096.1 2'-5' RNA ligase [Amycolatopsis marina]
MSVFPAELPASLDDPEVIREHDWEAFCQLTYMENHWDRPGWTPGRRSYHWMLTFDGADDVQQLAKRCQAQLPATKLDPVPLDALHLTIGRIGFTDEVTKTSVRAIAKEAERSLDLEPFVLGVGPLAGSSGAARFSVTPWSPLLDLHRQLTAATRTVLGERCSMETSKFRPHLSIAYANDRLPVSDLLPLYEELRTLPPITMSAWSAVLIEMRRDGHTYRFGEVFRVPFN